MNKKLLLLDLDETLITTSLRQYNVISDFLKIHLNLPCCDYVKYLTLRKEQTLSNFDFYKLQNPNNDHDANFKKFYLNMIESKKYLAFDELIVEIDLLKKILLNNYSVILISLRNNVIESTNQLKNIGLFPIFDEIHFIGHRNTNYNPKTPIIKKIIADKKTIIGFVGDSKNDYLAAKESSIPFYYVSTGIYNYNLDSFCYQSINTLITKLLKQ